MCMRACVCVCVRVCVHVLTHNTLAATLIHTWTILSRAALVLECSRRVGRTTWSRTSSNWTSRRGPMELSRNKCRCTEHAIAHTPLPPTRCITNKWPTGKQFCFTRLQQFNYRLFPPNWAPCYCLLPSSLLH